MSRREEYLGADMAPQGSTFRLGTAACVMLATVALGCSSKYETDSPLLFTTKEKTVRAIQPVANITDVPLQIPLMIQPEGIPDRNPATN